jgi:hypothetical protein
MDGFHGRVRRSLSVSVSASVSVSHSLIRSVVTTGTVLGGIIALQRKRVLSRNAVFRAAFALAKNSPEVAAALGGKVALGPLKAYRIHGGRVGFNGGMIGWIPPRVQMLIQVQGPSGVVSSARRGSSRSRLTDVRSPASFPQRADWRRASWT